MSNETFTFTDGNDVDTEVPTEIEGYKISLHEKSDDFQIEDADGRVYVLLNAGEWDYYGPEARYRRPNQGLIGLWFNQCAPTRLLVWADGLEAALELCAGWLADNAPGTFTTFDEHDIAAARKEVAEEQGIKPEDVSDEDLYEHLEVDHTYTEGGLIPSWEWGDLGSPEGNPIPDDLVKVVVDLGKLVNPPEAEDE
ncbi:MAG: hypothetical protein ABIY37_04005 [Devosia sp.]